MNLALALLIASAPAVSTESAAPTRWYGYQTLLMDAAAVGLGFAASGVRQSESIEGQLLLMGTLAVGGGAYALMPGENCQPTSPGLATPALPQANTDCKPRSSSSGSGGSSRTPQ